MVEEISTYRHEKLIWVSSRKLNLNLAKVPGRDDVIDEKLAESLIKLVATHKRGRLIFIWASCSIEKTTHIE